MVALPTLAKLFSVVAALASADGAVQVQASTASSSFTSASSTTASISSIQQQYEELCSPPKSCSIRRSNGDDEKNNVCSYDTLRGLAMTRQHMQANHHQRNSNSSSEAAAAAMALKLRLSRIKLEEASVGCTLLYRHHPNRHEADDSEIIMGSKNDGNEICPMPKTCHDAFSTSNNNALHENNNGAVKKDVACDSHHFHQLQKSRDALELSFHETAAASSSDQYERLARQWELTDLRAEMSVVGCVLMMKRQRETIGTNVDDIRGEVNPDDEERFNYFLQQNYRHFRSSAEMKALLKGLEEIINKRMKIELVLHSAGQGEIPDIVWQERVSREHAVERLRREERVVRHRLLDMLQHRLDDGTVKLSDLDRNERTTRSPMREKDEINSWEMIGHPLERKNSAEKEKEVETQQRKAEQQRNLAEANQKQEKERSMKKKIRQIWNQEHHKDSDDGDLFSPRAASSSPSQECNASSGDKVESCTTPNPSSSESQVKLIFKTMKKDIDLLRRKATEAFSEQERDARLSLVREMEKRLELLMNEPTIIAA